MGDVVGLPPKTKPLDLVWVCGCGCMTSYLHSNGRAVCAGCDELVDGARGDWRLDLPDRLPPAPKDVDGARVARDFNEPGIAIRRFMKGFVPDETVAIVAMDQRGEVRAWGGVTGTEERIAWLDRCLAQARVSLIKRLAGDAGG